MKRYLKNLLIFITIISSTVACNFLNEENYSEFDSRKFYTDSLKVIFAVNGCYDDLQKLAANFVTCTEVPTDYVCISLSGKNAKEANWHNGIFTYTDDWPQTLWGHLYKVIFDCNSLVDNVGQASISENLKDRCIAEARCIRGWAYLMLTSLFEDVPLRLSSKYGENFDCPLSAQSKVYEAILEDLEFAEENLYEFAFGRKFPDAKGIYNDTERMRVSVDAAIGLQAMAYLYMAKNDGESPYWEMARDKAKSLIDRCGGIDAAVSSGWLSRSYYNLFRGKTKYDRENLFAIYYDNSGKGEGSGIANNWAIFKNYSKAPNAGYRRFTQIWYDKHFAGRYDLRNAEGIMHEIVNDKGAKFIFPDKNAFLVEMGRAPEDGYKDNLGAKAYGPWCSKYNDPNAGTAGGCETGVILLRYAEVLLIFAEAENEVNGPTADAYAALNQIRQRAGAELIPDGMDKDTFRTFVLEEREKELFGEGKRLFDLNRREMYGAKISMTEYDKELDTGAFEYEGINRKRDYKVKYFDIPKSEKDANRAL